MKLTDKQIEALTAFRDVMDKYDIDIMTEDGGYFLRCGNKIICGTWTNSCTFASDIKELLQEQE